MATLALYLDNTPADLPDGAAQNVRLNGATNDASQLDSRVAERSYSFTLPATLTNDRIFQHARRQLTLGKFTRPTDIAARLTCDGVDVLGAGAICRLNRTGPTGYEVNLYSAILGIAETLDLPLRSITSFPDRSFSSTADLMDIAANTDRTAEDYAAPLIAYGNFYGTDDTDPLNQIIPLQLDDVALSVYCLNTLEAIFRGVGYRIEGAPLLSPLWQRAVMPFTGPGPMPWNWGKLAKLDAFINIAEASGATPLSSIDNDPCELMQVVNIDGVATVPEYTNDGAIPGPGSAIYVVCGTFTCPIKGEYNFNGFLGVAFDIPPDSYTGPYGKFYAIISGRGEDLAVELIGPGGTSGQDLYPYSETIALEKGEQVRLVALSQLVSYRSITATLKVRPAGLPTVLNPANWLPSLTQREFLKAFLTLTNSDISIDAARKVVRFSYRDTLTMADAESALVLDGAMNPDALSYAPASLFKSVAFTYAEDTSDALSVAGSANRTVATGAAGRTEVKTLSVPFAPTGLRQYLLTFGATTTHYLPTMASAEDLLKPHSEVQWTYDHTPRILVLQAADSSSPYITIGTREVESFYAPTAVFDTDPAGSLGFSGDAGRASAHYLTTLEMLLASELATGSITLTPALFRALTPGRVVKLGGMLYRVNSLTNYRPAITAPATIELLRYLPPSGR